MIFRRRTPLTGTRRLRSLLLPSGGWRRSLKYLMYRLRRIPDPPHRIARGVACGILASFTPLFGLHFMIAALLALIIRGNVIAALIGTGVGNPLTFPLIAILSLDLGKSILGSGADPVPMTQIMSAFGQAGDEIFRNALAIFTADVMRWDRLARFFRYLFLPYLVGGLALGLVAALAGYWLSLPALKAYQKLRAARRELRLRKRAKRPPSGPHESE